MANPVFTIMPNPHWVIIDNFSRLPDGAAIYTYSSLNPSVFKPAFQDSSGTIPYGQPIVGFGNGTMPPIFWEFDPNTPDDTYYIRVYDSADTTTQQFLWDFDGLSGATGGGGGTIVTAYNIENLVVNNIFYRNIGNQPTLPTFLTLAPSNNAGFVGSSTNAGGSPGPDIIFAKNVTTATDQLSFIDFSPLGNHDLPGNEITPEIFVRYQCGVAGAGETYKYIQFPIYQGLEALSAQDVTVRIYAKVNSGDPTLTLSWRLFFGDGGAPSADIVSTIGVCPLISTWKSFTFPSITPTSIGGTAGTCGNGGLFLQINYPLSVVTSIDMIKPAVYLGQVSPGIDFTSHDEIDAIVNSPRTGDTRTSLNNFLPGWINMNDGTIGNTGSGGTARSNIDTFPLFSLIWNNFLSNQSLAPMFTNVGVPIAYGVSAVADFVANRRLSLTRNLGRVMAGALPLQVSQAFTNVGNVLTVISTASFYTGVPVVVIGGGLPTPLVSGRTYYAIFLSPTTLSLASSPENAILNIPIVLTSNAAGTVTVSAHALGSFLGQETHTLISTELPDPITTTAQNHDASDVPNIFGAIASAGTTGTGTISNLGGNQPHNIMQPTVFMNVFIKL